MRANGNAYTRKCTRSSGLCLPTLSVLLEEVDESELLLNGETRIHLGAAKQARESGEFKRALEEVGKALFVALDAAVVVGRPQIGIAKAEDALKLTAFGVSANDFLRLQEFLPRVSGLPRALTEDPLEIVWKQSGFGHPGNNWNDEVVGFCLSTCLNIALGVQNAAPIPYARRFSMVYHYRVTAKRDGVAVWEDLAGREEHLEGSLFEGVPAV